MKIIGLLGGMSWESTQVYYRELNERINRKLGALHSAPMVMINVDFQPIEQLMQAGQWNQISQALQHHCKNLQQAGAECVAIATNTMHKLATEIESVIEVPLIHIADAVGKNLAKQGFKTIGLLGTEFTMQERFYSSRLKEYHDINTMVPDHHDQELINQVIFDELCRGIFRAESKQKYLTIIEKLEQRGADAVVLACTEIGLLIKQADTDTPLVDATEVHINEIAGFALSKPVQ